MRRVAVIGPVGAGKSTFATQVARTLQLPLHRLDDLYFTRDPRPSDQEWREEQDRLAAGPVWVIDGDHRATLPSRLARADTVIWLDYSRFVCARRVVRRSMTGHRAGSFRDLLTWILRYPSNGRAQTEGSMLGAPHVRLHRLRRPREAEVLLGRIHHL